jgi:hypothetical protein
LPILHALAFRPDQEHPEIGLNQILAKGQQPLAIANIQSHLNKKRASTLNILRVLMILMKPPLPRVPFSMVSGFPASSKLQACSISYKKLLPMSILS